MNWGDPAAKHAHLVDAKGQVPLSDVRDSMSSFSFTSSGNPGFVAGNYKYVYIKDLGDLHERVNRLVSTENENTPDGQITLMFGSIFGSTTGARNGLIAR